MEHPQEAADRKLERLKFKHAQSIELLRATTAFEHAALRLVFLMNGGALVAFVALFGSLSARDVTSSLERDAEPSPP